MADTMTAAPADAETPAESTDLSQGYCVELSVLPDGTFKVSGPEPLAEEAEEEQGEPGSEMGQDFDGIAEALKGMLRIIKDNPVGKDEQADFNAGFQSQ